MYPMRRSQFEAILDARYVAMLDAIIEDENEVRPQIVTIIGEDGKQYRIPFRCSRKQARQIKLAVFDAGGDAFAVER